MDLLISAWTTAVWWSAVIFFVGLMLALVTLVFALVCVIIAGLLDRWAARKEDRE